jgi:hypothetical protein
LGGSRRQFRYLGGNKNPRAGLVLQQSFRMVVSALSRTLAVAQNVGFATICIESFGGFSRVKAATIK